MDDHYCRVLTCGKAVPFGTTICRECAVSLYGGEDGVGDRPRVDSGS